LCRTEVENFRPNKPNITTLIYVLSIYVYIVYVLYGCYYYWFLLRAFIYRGLKNGMLSDKDKKEIYCLLAIDMLLGGFMSSGCEIAEMLESASPEEIQEIIDLFTEN